MTKVQYLTAADWGMRWERKPQPEVLKDPEVYIHHTAGSHVNEAGEALRALNEYAITAKGYSALDYDILVHHDPVHDILTIAEGRGRYMSAATLDRNEQGEAVCVLGYFHPGHKLSRQPRAAEVEGVALAILWGIEKGWIAKDAKILGHKDNPAHPNATGCPGDYLYRFLPAIRARVMAALAPPPPEETVINFKLPDAVLATVKTAPPTAAVLDGTGKNDDWWAIIVTKALQAASGLPVTGRYDQRTGDALNALVAKYIK